MLPLPLMWYTAISASTKLIPRDSIAQKRRHFLGTVKKNLSAFSSCTNDNNSDGSGKGGKYILVDSCSVDYWNELEFLVHNTME